MNVGSAGSGPIMLIVMVPAQCGQGVVASLFDGALIYEWLAAMPIATSNPPH
jgi:hypothetical protein